MASLVTRTRPSPLDPDKSEGLTYMHRRQFPKFFGFALGPHPGGSNDATHSPHHSHRSRPVDPHSGSTERLRWRHPAHRRSRLRFESVRLGPDRGQGGHLPDVLRSEEHTSELQSRGHLVCRLLLEKKKPSILTTSGL